jgi:hypothetical protein
MQIAISRTTARHRTGTVLIVVLVFLIPAARGKHDTPREGEPTDVEFPDKHVHVSVPWQGYAVRVLRIPYPPLSELPQIEVAGQPWPYGGLLNVVVARHDDSDALVTQFNPPLTLRMAYSQESLERAKEFIGLSVFGFWDGCQWCSSRKKSTTCRTSPAQIRQATSQVMPSSNYRHGRSFIGHGP